MFKNIGVIARKNLRLLRLAELTARTFPSATYHLLTVVPTYESRPIPGTMVKDVFQEITDDALKGIKLSILRFNVLSIKEVRLYGEVKTAITGYVLSKRIDLLVHAITPGEKPGEAMPVNLDEILRNSETSFLLHTSYMEDVPESVGKVAIITGETPQDIIGKLGKAVNYLGSKGFLKEVFLVCGEKRFCDLIIEKSSIKSLDIFLTRITEVEENLGELLRDLSRDVDLVIGCRNILSRCQFSRESSVQKGNSLIHSKAPLLLL